MSDIYKNISHEFIRFKTSLLSEINNKKWNPNTKNDCFCIKEKWFNEFEKQINKFNTNGNTKKDSKNNIIKIFLENNFPEFINDISSAMEILGKASNLKLISKKFVQLLYPEELFLKNNSVKYYAGNNRLIIEFKNESNNISDVLLIINPLEKIFSQREIYYFSIKNKDEKKIAVFMSLIDNEKTDKFFSNNKLNLKKLKLINEISNELKEKKILSAKPDEPINHILKFLIAIYCYELSLTNKNNKANFINKNERSYLINPEWIESIKSIYKYTKLIKIFINLTKEFNYSNYLDEVERVYNACKDNSEIQNISWSEDALTDGLLIPKEKEGNNSTFIESCYILPKIIFKIIRKLLFK